MSMKTLRALLTMLAALVALSVPTCFYLAAWTSNYEDELVATGCISLFLAIPLVGLTALLWEVP